MLCQCRFTLLSLGRDCILNLHCDHIGKIIVRALCKRRDAVNFAAVVESAEKGKLKRFAFDVYFWFYQAPFFFSLYFPGMVEYGQAECCA